MMQPTRLYTILFVFFFFSSTASAQVFDSGPSSSALFTNVINSPSDVLPDSVGGVNGETVQVNVANNGSVNDFFTVLVGGELNISGGIVGDFVSAETGTEVNISGGTVGGPFGALGGEVNISGGIVGDDFFVGEDSTVNVSGGVVGNFLDTATGSVLNISGGSIGDLIFAFAGSEVNISGGSVGILFEARTDSVINISGGSVGDGFFAENGSDVNLFGSDFAIDGVLIDDLVASEAFTVLNRNATLSGVLADGSEFSFDLNPAFLGGDEDIFQPDATLTVTLASVLLGDVNQDGIVNFLDITAFVAVLAANEFLAEADFNGDAVVNFLDITPFIALLASR